MNSIGQMIKSKLSSKSGFSELELDNNIGINNFKVKINDRRIKTNLCTRRWARLGNKVISFAEKKI